jgi:hypothetical protein
MTTRFELDRQAAANTAQAEANRAALENWLSRHPRIPDCIAVRNLFEEYMDFTEPLSDVDFDFALGNLESQIGKQRVPPPAEVKQGLIGEICDLLRSPNSDGRGGCYSDVALVNERKRLQTFTKDQLVQRRDSIIEAQRLQKLSAGQIRQELQASRPEPQVKVLPAEISRERIHAMPSPQIRKLIRDFGANVVNDRILGRN